MWSGLNPRYSGGKLKTIVRVSDTKVRLGVCNLLAAPGLWARLAMKRATLHFVASLTHRADALDQLLAAAVRSPAQEAELVACRDSLNSPRSPARVTSR